VAVAAMEASKVMSPLAPEELPWEVATDKQVHNEAKPPKRPTVSGDSAQGAVAKSPDGAAALAWPCGLQHLINGTAQVFFGKGHHTPPSTLCTPPARR
jgi:hypothetical protein